MVWLDIKVEFGELCHTVWNQWSSISLHLNTAFPCAGLNHLVVNNQTIAEFYFTEKVREKQINGTIISLFIFLVIPAFLCNQVTSMSRKS